MQSKHPWKCFWGVKKYLFWLTVAKTWTPKQIFFNEGQRKRKSTQLRWGYFLDTSHSDIQFPFYINSVRPCGCVSRLRDITSSRGAQTVLRHLKINNEQTTGASCNGPAKSLGHAALASVCADGLQRKVRLQQQQKKWLPPPPPTHTHTLGFNGGALPQWVTNHRSSRLETLCHHQLSLLFYVCSN